MSKAVFFLNNSKINRQETKEGTNNTTYSINIESIINIEM